MPLPRGLLVISPLVPLESGRVTLLPNTPDHPLSVEEIESQSEDFFRRYPDGDLTFSGWEEEHTFAKLKKLSFSKPVRLQVDVSSHQGLGFLPLVKEAIALGWSLDLWITSPPSAETQQQLRSLPEDRFRLVIVDALTYSPEIVASTWQFLSLPVFRWQKHPSQQNDFCYIDTQGKPLTFPERPFLLRNLARFLSRLSESPLHPAFFSFALVLARWFALPLCERWSYLRTILREAKHCWEWWFYFHTGRLRAWWRARRGNLL